MLPTGHHHHHLLLLLVGTVGSVASAAADRGDNFTFTGFREANLNLSGLAVITPSGILQLTNDTQQRMGQAFFPSPFRFFETNGSNPLSFSTTFVVAVDNSTKSFGDGMTFLLSPSRQLSGAGVGQYLGIFNVTNNGKPSNHIVAVELDTAYTVEVKDIDYDHVGIDVNGLKSIVSAHAAYFNDQHRRWVNLSLVSDELQSFQTWIDYDGRKKQMRVTIAPAGVGRPSLPLLKLPIDLSSILLTDTFVGFTAATGTATSSHYVLGWSFGVDGEAPPLDLSKLPPLPRPPKGPKRVSPVLVLVLSFTAAIVFLLLSFVMVFVVVSRRRKFAEIREDWEVEYGPQRFSYKELYKATNGFSHRIGDGGFGTVYKGVLCSSRWACSDIAVKIMREDQDSQQRMKDFVAEITVGGLDHLNLVKVLGYCRRKGEFIIVYEYMTNGSVDEYISPIENMSRPLLRWAQRFHIIKGVAAGLHFLHKELPSEIIHRDVKTANVLLDDDMNGKLGDFGLARLYHRGSDPRTTCCLGTPGYVAPDLILRGKATTATDVYAFGSFVLAITCGRMPIREVGGRDQLLTDWVFGLWESGDVTTAVDRRMGEDYNAAEVKKVLLLGLLCTQRDPDSRPRIEEVVSILQGNTEAEFNSRVAKMKPPPAWNEGFDDVFVTAPATLVQISTSTSTSPADHCSPALSSP